MPAENAAPASANEDEEIDRCHTPKCGNKNQQSCTPKQSKQILERIQRDLNSPSANVRIRAIKALKSPTKSAYAQFDVPHNEISIITAEERKTPPPPLTLEELMRDVVIYVEVRNHEDNRSDGIKKYISALGARVNNKLYKDTTHVIFKDGLLSTYKKARNWNIPVVSLLWVEACKEKRQICDPIDYQIFNVDRYENPELYDKFKRHKSMQPDSECNKRIRTKNGRLKETNTPTNAVVEKSGTKKTLPLNAGTPGSARSQKTGIGHYFKQVGSVGRPIAESPSTQLLDRVNANQHTPILTQNEVNDSVQCIDLETNTGASESTPIPKDAKKTLCYDTAENAHEITQTEHLTQRRTSRRTLMYQTKQSLDPVSISQDQKITEVTTALSLLNTNTTRQRRKTIYASKKTTINAPVVENPTIPEKEVAVPQQDANMDISKKVNNWLEKRRTTLTHKTLEISKGALKTCKDSAKNRRTLHTHVNMEVEKTTEHIDVSSDQLNNTLNRTDYELTPIPSKVASSTLLEEKHTPLQNNLLLASISTPFIFNSARKPGNRRTMFDISMDIISHRLQNINELSRCSNPTVVDECLFLNESNNLTKQNAQKEHKKTSTDDNNETGAKDDVQSSVGAETTPITAAKKRKLFMPNECHILTPPIATNAKRRRTLMPLILPQTPTKPIASTKTIFKKKELQRRSTMDFEKKTETATKPQLSKELNVEVSNRAALVAATVTNNQHMNDAAKKKLPFLVCTNMRKAQIEVMQEAIDKLGGFNLAPSVTTESTHLVSFEARRTLNILRALVRGIWILDYNWVIESMQAGKWLREEEYQLRDFSRAVEICRAERQAFGNTYKCELLTDVGSFYISSRCNTPITKDDLSELIVLCGGKIVERRKSARYIVGGDEALILDDKIYVTQYWILDCITQMKLLKYQKYLSFAKPTPTNDIELPIENGL